MVMNIGDALAAYKQGGGASGPAAGGASGATGSQSFSNVLKGFADDAVQSIEGGEAAAKDAATGKANIASVVIAMTDAEQMLQTIVTIRDKVISAYQTISQTAI